MLVIKRYQDAQHNLKYIVYVENLDDILGFTRLTDLRHILPIFTRSLRLQAQKIAQREAKAEAT